MKKVLFIIPPYFDFKNYVTDKSLHPVFTIPYGILSLDSYIKKNSNVEVKIDLLDLNLELFKDSTLEIKDIIKIKIDKENYDIVGISTLFNSSYTYVGEILNTIKNYSSPILCVIGGGLASNLYKTLLEDFPSLDGVCVGEGEIPLVDLLNSENYFQTLETHKSWVTRYTVNIDKKFEPTYVENLDDIPQFDYNLINLDDYNGRSLDKRYRNEEGKRELSIHTSRGCVFNCSYCSNVSVHGKKIRYMSEGRVLSEIDNMIEKFGMNVLLIEDDHFLSKQKRAVYLLSEITKRNIRVEFPNGIAVYAITDEIGKLLKSAGVGVVQLAVESCSDYVLKELINKPHNVEKIRKAVKILKNNNILIHAFIVLGLPGELDKYREESLKIIKELEFDWVYFFIATPIVGSRLYDDCIKNNYIVEKDFKKHLVSKGTIKAPGVNPEKIEKLAYEYNIDVNFKNNSNVRNKKYGIALSYFEDIIKKYPFHIYAQEILKEIKENVNYTFNRI